VYGMWNELMRNSGHLNDSRYLPVVFLTQSAVVSFCRMHLELLIPFSFLAHFFLINYLYLSKLIVMYLCSYVLVRICCGILYFCCLFQMVI